MITTSLEVSLLFLTVEFGLAALAILYFAHRGRRVATEETEADVSALVTKVSQTEDERRAALTSVFRDTYQFEGEELESVAQEFMLREKAFYNAVVGAVLGRGEAKIADINDELTKVVAPWIELTPQNMLDSESAEALVEEKSRLESELGETKSVLEKMIAEYNRAFRIESSDEAQAEAGDAGTSDDEMDEIGDLDEEIFTSDEVVDNAEQEQSSVEANEQTQEETAEAPPAESIELGGDDDDLIAADGDPDDQPMTADDLDDLMQSLESDTAQDTESA